MSHTTKNILVTGGAGFIGSNFVHYWHKKYPDNKIVVLDSLTYAGNNENLKSVVGNPNIIFMQKDILDTTAVEIALKSHNIDCIVHFAAESHVDRSIHSPDIFLTTNILGTHSLLKAAKSVWLDQDEKLNHRFHHVSTDEVYGSLTPEDLPFSETNSYFPNSPYAASKASSDHLVRCYNHTYGLNTTISNCSNNYGPYQFPEKLIPLVILNCLDGKPLPIYGDGLQIRDWLYVDDHILGVDLIIHEGEVGHTYNIGGNNEISNLEIVNQLCQLMDKYHSAGAPHKQLITHVKDRAGHDKRYAINASKITKELRYHPKESFLTGIQKTVKWYIENEQWCMNILDGSYQEWIKTNYSD